MLLAETNLLEQQEKGLLTEDPQQIYSGEDYWETLRSSLSGIRLGDLATITGIDERRLREYRGGKRPRPRRMARIAAGIVEYLRSIRD